MSIRSTIRRQLILGGLATMLAALSACAGHKELKAPCAETSALFSSTAYAEDTSCGPLVRQHGVSLL